ncbi:tetratricopeptide repeat protein [Pseudomonas sp. St29]|uniref:tetratricopeptide repeat protein n=1 Tax=Pseudomonas sp. St29 TaxID=1500687 RepID=UPI0005FC6754|nr:sel1 repeat family protein [Pseudomonas sp. St29]BAQ82034.1 Sel1 repeat-containing protein [Pseudomonas sp. St29]
MIKHILIGALCGLLFSTCAAAQLTESQQAARDKGLVLYQQSDWYDSQPLLQVAAAAGDRTAQYYLAEAIRLSSSYTTLEARQWYEAAAEQGDLYAMLRLSNSSDLCHQMGTCTGKAGPEWRKTALKLAHERAEQGDTEAMTVLYTARQGLGWLEKAAEAGDSYAQKLLAGVYEDGAGWFFIPGNRQKAVKKWFKASAEGGYPLGMFSYANYLYENNGSKEEIGYWVKKGAEGGHIDSVSTYASNLAHLPNELDYPLNLIEDYGLTYLMSKFEGGGAGGGAGIADFSKKVLGKISAQLTSDEIKQGVAFAEEWEKTHPPLSYFVPVYGY